MLEPERSTARNWIAIAAALAVVIGGALVYRCSGSGEPAPAASAVGSGSAAAAIAPARCKPVTNEEGFIIGNRGSMKPVPADPQAPDLDLDTEPDLDEPLAPFAVVLGRATRYEKGFALGVLGDSEGGSAAFVVTVAADGTKGESTKLFRSRADLDPPVVAAGPGGALYVAALEPSGLDRALRLARVSGSEIAWGAEVLERRDDSLAIDIAVTERRGVVVWDVVEDDHSYVQVGGFSIEGFGALTSTRRATTKEMEAHGPRVVATKSGFYLAYLVEGGEAARESVGDKGAKKPTPDEPSPSTSSSAAASARPAATVDAVGSPKKKKKKKSEALEDEVDETKGGESISSSWIEVVPLDETGAQASDAVRVTPEDVTVESFDVAAGPDGSLIVAFRDDDAPTGGAGGIVRMISVRSGSVGANYASEEPLPSEGVPSIVTGWVGIPTYAGSALLARLGPDGMPAEPLGREPSLGRGEPIAADANRLLLADPAGGAMKFRVVECAESATPK